MREERISEQSEEWKSIKENISETKHENNDWKQEKFQRPGLILPCLRLVFDIISIFSIGTWLSQTNKKRIVSRQIVLSNILLGMFSYRLLDIFQSWVKQFVLRYKWNAINANRSLVLSVINYIEIIIIGTIVRQIFIKSSPLYYSIASAVANPQSKDASAIQCVQIMFSILFLTVVAQQIIARITNQTKAKNE